MSWPDGALPPETEAPVELVRLSRANYPKDTLGYAYFPEILEGRLRPADCLNRPLWLGPKTTTLVEGLGITALSGLLYATEAQVASLPTRNRREVTKKLAGSVDELVRRQALTPHGQLVRAVLNKRQGSVEAVDEPALKQVVENVLDAATLDDRQRRVLREQFGLVDWHPRNMVVIGEELKVRPQRVRQITEAALGKLRPAQHSEELRHFSALPLEAVGRWVGITYVRDIPALPISAQELELGDDVTERLQAVNPTYGSGAGGFAELMMAILPAVPDDMREAVTAKIRQALQA